MAIHTVGTPIKISEIVTEFGGTGPNNRLSQYYRGGSYVPSGSTQNASIPISGSINMSGFYGSQLAPTALMFSGASFSIAGPSIKLQYITPGVYTFTVPLHVTSISIGAIGSGGGGAGGRGNTYNSDPYPRQFGVCGGNGSVVSGTYSVIPLASYTITVGAGGNPGHFSWAGGAYSEGARADGSAGNASAVSGLLSAAGGIAGTGLIAYPGSPSYAPTPAATTPTVDTNSVAVLNTYSYGPPTAHYNSSMPAQSSSNVPYGNGGNGGPAYSYYGYEPNPGASGYVVITFNYY